MKSLSQRDVFEALESPTQSNSESSAIDTFNDLCRSAKTDAKRRSLEIVWTALSELHSEGVPDFSIARVGRRVEKLGGPKPQSIRNKGGRDYRLLIEVFAKAQQIMTRRRRERTPSQVEQAIEEIPDLAVRVVLKMTLEEQKRLKHENDILRSAYRELSVDLRQGDQKPYVPTQAVESTICTHAPVSAEYILAFEKFVSNEWLDERGLRIDPDGSIIDEGAGDNIIAPPKFADGLQQVISTMRHP